MGGRSGNGNRNTKAISTYVSREAVDTATSFAYTMKGSIVDTQNRTIQIPFGPRTTEEDISGKYGTATMFRNLGFDVSFEKRDVEYTSKTRGNTRRDHMEGGNKRMLRNRLVMTLKWKGENE